MMERTPENLLKSLQKQLDEKPLTPEEEEQLKVEKEKGDTLIASDHEKKKSVVTPAMLKDAQRHEKYHSVRTKEQDD